MKIVTTETSPMSHVTASQNSTKKKYTVMTETSPISHVTVSIYTLEKYKYK